MRRRNPILRVRRLSVRPGETLVLEVPGDISPGQASALRSKWHERFPDVPVVVLVGARLAGVVATEEDVADTLSGESLDA